MLIDVFIYKIIVNNNDDVEIIMCIDNKNCDMYGGVMPSISELVIVRVLFPETLNVSTILRPPSSLS